MAIDLNKKYNYKLKNKKTGKFYSTGKKATWAQATAVINLFKGNGYRRLKRDEWDVVLIPLDNPLVISSIDFIAHYKERDDAREQKRLDKIQKQMEAIEKQNASREISELKRLQKKYPNA